MKHTNSTFVLTCNAGSSSLKLAVFAVGESRATLEASVVNLGFSATLITEAEKRTVVAPRHIDAATLLLDWLKNHLNVAKIIGVGHRIVHGGPHYHAPQLATKIVLADLQKFEAFDPEHLPAQLALVTTFQELFPQLPQVLCFDTAFHHNLPPRARRLAVPRQLEAAGVRRYGFHGLSYTFIADELRRTKGEAAIRGKTIIAHLGNGVSVTALQDGAPMDTTMSMTPASGVPMSSRSGDLDPGLFLYLARTQGYNLEQLNRMVHTESGLLGISETTSDMKQLLMFAATDTRAQEAIEIFCYQVKKVIGSFAAALGGVDRLIFTGGMGENAPKIRAMICENLGFLGIVIDEERNQRSNGSLSAEGSSTEVYVMHTDEAVTIMRQTLATINHN